MTPAEEFMGMEMGWRGVFALALAAVIAAGVQTHAGGHEHDFPLRS